MKVLSVAMLVCAGLAVPASQGERVATVGYTASWLTSKELGGYVDLILARLQSARASTSRVLFLGYLEEPSRACAIRVNPDDLGGEFVTRHTVAFKGDHGTWTQLYEDSDLGHELFVDIDGDGVPETVGGTGYESVALWKIYPKKSLPGLFPGCRVARPPRVRR